MVESETRCDAAAHRVTEDVRLLDSQFVEQGRDSIRRNPMVGAVHLGTRARAEAGLVGNDRPEVLREQGQVRTEVAPPRDTGARAVQHDEGFTLAGDVVAQRGGAVEGAPGSLAGDVYRVQHLVSYRGGREVQEAVGAASTMGSSTAEAATPPQRTVWVRTAPSIPPTMG